MVSKGIVLKGSNIWYFSLREEYVSRTHCHIKYLYKCWVCLLICTHHFNLYSHQENNYSRQLRWGIKINSYPLVKMKHIYQSVFCHNKYFIFAPQLNFQLFFLIRALIQMMHMNWPTHHSSLSIKNGFLPNTVSYHVHICMYVHVLTDVQIKFIIVLTKDRMHLITQSDIKYVHECTYLHIIIYHLINKWTCTPILFFCYSLKCPPMKLHIMPSIHNITTYSSLIFLWSFALELSYLLIWQLSPFITTIYFFYLTSYLWRRNNRY